MIAIDYCSR
ncbi:CPXV004 protein [Cowpox virus]|uniref:CPXV004 protein n=1 Tax=Cowpox virus TaxID=10243 RepID=U5TG27_COWPX|nr:CPXV004 protein [Cowpox virus]AGZ01287.1 CPXV004 protein [Cowpox virus]